MFFCPAKKTKSTRQTQNRMLKNDDDDDDHLGAAPRPNRSSNERVLRFSGPGHGRLIPTAGDWRARLTWLAAPANMPSSASSPPTFCLPLAALLHPVSGLLLFTRQTVFTGDVQRGSLLATYHWLPSESDTQHRRLFTIWQQLAGFTAVAVNSGTSCFLPFSMWVS